MGVSGVFGPEDWITGTFITAFGDSTGAKLRCVLSSCEVVPCRIIELATSSCLGDDLRVSDDKGFLVSRRLSLFDMMEELEESTTEAALWPWVVLFGPIGSGGVILCCIWPFLFSVLWQLDCAGVKIRRDNSDSDSYDRHSVRRIYLQFSKTEFAHLFRKTESSVICIHFSKFE